MKGLLGDVRLAFRRVASSPGLTLLIVATFALGIGANTAVFSLFDQALLRTLPVKDPGQLVLLDTPGPNSGSISNNKQSPFPMSYPMFTDFRDKTDAFSGVLTYFPTNVFLGVEGNTQRIQADLVSGTYFEVLGLLPSSGRLFSRADDVSPGAHPVVVLSHSFWNRRFAADPKIAGRTVRINATNMEVVGVAPPGFRGLEMGQEADIFVPLAMKQAATPTWDGLADRRSMFLTTLARLASGRTLEQAREKANVLYHQERRRNANLRFRQRSGGSLLLLLFSIFATPKIGS